MDTLIKNGVASFYADWCDRRTADAEYRTTPAAILLALVWIVAAIALILFFNRETMPFQFNLSDLNTSDLNTPQQVAYQQFANRYKDPLCAYFFGQ